MKLSVLREALVIPRINGSATAAWPPFSMTSRLTSSNRVRSICSSLMKSVSPGSRTFTRRIICRTITSTVLVVDAHALQPVYLLDLVDQVAGESDLPLDSKDVLGDGRAAR